MPRKSRAGALNHVAGLPERTGGCLPRKEVTPPSPTALSQPTRTPKRSPPEASQCGKPSTGSTKHLETLSPVDMQTHKQEQNVAKGEDLCVRQLMRSSPRGTSGRMFKGGNREE